MGNKRVNVYIGTKKGAFVYTADAGRAKWSVPEIQFPGWAVHHMLRDPRNGRLYAALDHMVYGANVHRSDDDGATWEIATGPQFADTEERTVRRVWHIHPGPAGEPDVVYAGADPGALFRSEDGGLTWAEVTGLNDHPTSLLWQAGAGGKMVHTIIQHPTNPDRLFVAISAAGVFRSDDGGRTWAPKNQGVLADFMPDQYPEVGQCVHHLVMSPTNPDVLYQQNHCGVYRSDDAGDSWVDIGEGHLPSRFGFPIAIHREDPETVYTVPQVSPEYRYTPDGRFRVYRSRDRGQSWVALSNGLPQVNAYLGVYREAMVADTLSPGGVYVGTTGGHVYYTRDAGESWHSLANTLPPVYSISTAVVET